LARRRILAFLAETESKIEEPCRVAVHHVERHGLAQRVRALKQLLDEPRADPLSSELANEVKLPQMHVVDEIGHLNPADWFLSHANDPRRRKLVALAELQQNPWPVPLADLRQMLLGPFEIKRERKGVIAESRRSKPNFAPLRLLGLLASAQGRLALHV